MTAAPPQVVAESRHVAAMASLAAAHRAAPPDRPVRLGKRSSNLFRFDTAAKASAFGTAATATVLDTSALTGVVAVDPDARTAHVQGMTTYEDLVAATLPYGLMPTVVPQLRTITLGGAVTGLGVESTSFRHGLPHEAVRAMDVLTPAGELVHVTPHGPHAELHAAFPNSYGTLGYALGLEIDLLPVRRYVALEHRRVGTAELADAIVAAADDPDVDFLDGVVFGRDEQYLTLGRGIDAPDVAPSDYTGRQIFYRSVRERRTDVLTAEDYLWRWDTDWFWCSKALGVQHPVVRRLWPRRYRRSDVYRRIVALDRRTQASRRVATLLGRPTEEPVVQDVEIPVGRLGEFLDAFHTDLGIAPIWLCPMRLRDTRAWPLYPMVPGELYVNVGFWSAVPEIPGRPDGHNRRVEELVAELGGHKSLYSSVHYDAAEFWRRYNGPAYRTVKDRYDPAGRAPDLHTKVTGGRA